METQDVRLQHFATREEWLDARVTGIGASESAALFGHSPWDSELSLWTKKRGLDESADEEREWMRIGSLMEPVVATLYAEKTGRALWAPTTSWAIARHPEIPYLTASIDRWVIEAPGKPGRGVLEMKNVGFGMSHEWDEGPPLRVSVQLQHQLAVTGFQWGSAAGILGGNRFVSWDFERNEEFIEALKEECARFWALVTAGKMPPPDGTKATERALKKLYPRDNGDAVHLDDESAILWTELASIRAQKGKAEKRERELKNLLGASIGEATFGLLPDGRLLSYRRQERDGYMVAPTEFRTLKEEKKNTNSDAPFDQLIDASSLGSKEGRHAR
jgi:putative phage-type endonuclease